MPPLSHPQDVVEVTVRVLVFWPLFRKSLSAAVCMSVVSTDCGKLCAPYAAPARAAFPTRMLIYAYRPSSMPPIKTASSIGVAMPPQSSFGPIANAKSAATRIGISPSARRIHVSCGSPSSPIPPEQRLEMTYARWQSSLAEQTNCGMAAQGQRISDYDSRS